MQRTKASLQAEAKFKARLLELGATLVDADWHGSHDKHHIQCAAGHDCHSRPSDVIKGDGICRTCAGNDPATSEAKFKARLAELGATLLEEKWLGRHTPHHVRCAAGHDRYPRPGDVIKGDGICRICAGIDSATAAANFKRRLEALGATLLELEWLGKDKPHRIRCAAGHEGTTSPGNVRQGKGVCRICVGLDSETAALNFRVSLKKLGATLIDTEWKGNQKRYRAICVNGHECLPMPNGVQQGRGICRICARTDPATAEAAFKAKLREIGATLIEPTWLGVMKPHQVLCAKGHQCKPRPNSLSNGSGICITCSGNDPAIAEHNFRQRLQELGVTLIEPNYLGKDKPHRAVCSVGHECAPRPSGLRDGEGACAVCAGKKWDAFYVVVNEKIRRLKFGVTSNGGKKRLRTHAKNGYNKIIKFITPMPDMAAVEMEEAVKAVLRLAKEKPVHGTEYFDISVLALVLDIVDNNEPIITIAP